MKKFLSTFIASFVLMIGVFALSGCGCTTLEELDISDTMTTKQNYLVSNVYNKPAGTDFNTAEEANYIEDEDYYVIVKENVHDILTTVTVGGVRFEDDDTVSLSVGNANFLVRNAWKLEDGKLKIASGLLLSSMKENGKVDVRYSNKQLSLIIMDEPSDIDFDIEVSGANANISEPVDGVYTYTSSNYAGRFNIKVTDKDGANLLDANSIITVQKIRRDSNDQNKIENITYGLTKADLVGGEYVIVYYPSYNEGQAFTPGDPSDYNMEFRFNVLGVGASSIKYNFVNSAT